MGLDITVYKKFSAVDVKDLPKDADGEIDYDETWGNYVETFAYAGMERSLRGLPDKGWVDVSDSESWGFRAGSYSGYSQFRTMLSEYALGVPPSAVWADPLGYVDKPFFELIQFADNEGTIGPEAAADLARDFLQHRDQIFAQESDEYFREKYDTWMKACVDAADTGLIVFH